MDPSSPPLEPREPSRWSESREVWESSSPPEPPAYGTVLPAPPVPGQLDHPQAPAARRSRWLATLAAAGFGVGVIGVGWAVLQRRTTVTAVDSGTSVPIAAVVPSTPEPPPAPPPVVPVPPPRCPDDMALIRGGKFFMGTDAEHPALRTANPAHRAEVEDFCLDLTEVTLGAYRECSSKGECKRAYRDSFWPQKDADEQDWNLQRSATSPLCNENYSDRDDHPVNCVTWYQADDYCKWRGATLPTEAQWEYAARGSDGRVYSWGDQKPDSELMNGCGLECSTWRKNAGLSETPILYEIDDGYPGSAPVGSFPAGRAEAGLLDMAGNVFEWTHDHHRPYADLDKLNPEHAETTERVIRGGAFNSFMPEFADPALRFPQSQDAHTHGIGFRCARTPLF